MGQFTNSVARFVTNTKQEIERVDRGIKLALFRAVILGSPVDEGRFRGNWQTSVGEPAAGTVSILDPSGGNAISAMQSALGGLGTLTYLTNNLPYASVLEFGGYPDPPKKGTWVQGKLGRKRKDGSRKRAAGHFEIRSVGGYSKQAPAGMVRINMARIESIVRAATAGQS